jgi:hypothetical protein
MGGKGENCVRCHCNRFPELNTREPRSRLIVTLINPIGPINQFASADGSHRSKIC